MRPFFLPRPNSNQIHHSADPNLPPAMARHRPLLPTPLNPCFPPPQPPIPNLAANFAGNPMAGVNPLVALQLLGQAQQLQNLGFLAAAALQQQQQHFLPGALPQNHLNQFANFANTHRPSVGFVGNGGGVGMSAPRPSVAAKESPARNCRNGGTMVHHPEHRADGNSNFSAPENAGRRNFAMNKKSRFNPGSNGKDGRPFGRSGGRGNARPFNQGRGRGSSNWRAGKSDLTKCGSPAIGERRRRAPIIYDENEVKQWREARKKNYPTSANIRKKLAPSESNGQNKDEATKLRRQQLKEVLAKQQELGCEVAEIPPGYLSEPDSQANQRKNNWKTGRRGDRFPNHFNNKRARYDQRDSQSKRPKLRNDTPGDAATVKSREPTLLQKLLSADIKRDRHRLVHAFKFMVLNNFFHDWPEKSLEFPTVTVKNTELESNIAIEDPDGMQNAGTKVNSAAVDEIGDERDSSSTDGESESNESSDEDSTEDDDSVSEAEAEQATVSEEQDLSE